MSSHRTARVANEIRQRLATILEENIEDPRLREVRLTGIDLTSDLGIAHVHFRTLDDAAAALQAFERAGPYLRRRVGEGLKVRRVPELRFVIDESLDKAERIEEILRDLEEESS